MFINTDFLRNDEIRLELEKTVDGDLEKDWVPAYHFFIANKEGARMGSCDLRIGHNEKLYFGGNIGGRGIQGKPLCRESLSAAVRTGEEAWIGICDYNMQSG